MDYKQAHIHVMWSSWFLNVHVRSFSWSNIWCGCFLAVPLCISGKCHFFFLFLVASLCIYGNSHHLGFAWILLGLMSFFITCTCMLCIYQVLILSGSYCDSTAVLFCMETSMGLIHQSFHTTHPSHTGTSQHLHSLPRKGGVAPSCDGFLDLAKLVSAGHFPGQGRESFVRVFAQ